jgi:hypothetical protein
MTKGVYHQPERFCLTQFLREKASLESMGWIVRTFPKEEAYPDGPPAIF